MRYRNRRNMRESYSDIDYSNVWEAYDIALEYMGERELLEALVRAMGTDELEDNLKYIFRVYEIPFMEDEVDESCCGKKSKKRKHRKSVKESASGRKIPYDLVSSLVVLRDYADTSDAYVNDEHKMLVDIADFLYNVDFEPDSLKKEAKEVYDKYGKTYFNKVIKDIEAIDSQISSSNVNDLIAEVNDKLSSFGVEIDESFRRNKIRSLREGSHPDPERVARHYYNSWANGLISSDEIRIELKKKYFSDREIDLVFSYLSEWYADEERYEYEHDYD